MHRFAPDGTVGRVLRKAERMSPLPARDELATVRDGRPCFVTEPPLQPIDEATRRKVLASLATYRDTLGPNRQQVLDCYLPFDVAFKVGGTGAIGGQNYVVLMLGNGSDDPLILQVKQALPSCYEAQGLVAADPHVAHQGRRVAEGQHRMQTWTDPFLGWTTIEDVPFYVRQLADHKAAIDPEDLRRASLVEYARVCGETFAKAHARSGDAAVLYGYAGRASKLDIAIGKLAGTAADQVAQDWEQLVAAIKRGDLEAVESE